MIGPRDRGGGQCDTLCRSEEDSKPDVAVLELTDAERDRREDPRPLDAKLSHVADIPIPATAAHVYTECARIWNPIHTDVAYARAAGLPDIILHGTATLAYSISALLKRWPHAVRRVTCRFAGMVFMPSTLSVHAARDGAAIQFETRNDRNELVISRGRLLLE